MTQNSLSPETVRAALLHIPANLEREGWARIGMAIKAEFPDETGFQIFNDWSATAPDAYDPAAARATWRSIKPDGGIGIGTLFFEAEKRGYRANPAERQSLPAYDPATLARESAEREAAERAAAEERDAAQAAAAERARELWESADESAAAGHGYIARKGIKPFGARVSAEGELLVPMRDGEGALWNVQRILPQKPAEGGTDKLFLKGGKVSGLWCMLGDPKAAPVILLAEGFATAASVHEATGHPTAAAFNAQNLKKTALALRQKFPDATIGICGDDDRATELRAGKNPGAQAAAQAAARVRGFCILPAGLAAGQSDFNDLHAGRGLEAVRAQIEAAFERFQVARAAPRAALAPPPPAEQAPPADDEPEAAHDPFSVTESGVYFQTRDKEGNPGRNLWLCGPLFVTARTRDPDGASWGFLLSFHDAENRPREWAAPARMLAGDGAELRARLLDMGLSISTSPAARAKLAEYIQTRRPQSLATSTERCGWHPSGDAGAVFVLPRRTISAPGALGERVIFQSDAGAVESNFRQRGDAAAWRERIGALCRGNSRLTFATSAAFAAPLLQLTGVGSGGFHFRGDSSCGKTTALLVAASVNGPPGYLQRWRATANALESIAAQHCDSLLILDELAQVDPREAGEAAYMLANEQSKARATRNGGARPRLRWRLLFLSAGEVGLADHLAEVGRRPRAGQEARMIDLASDAGAGLGIFEELHGRPDASAFANELQRAAASTYGAAGLAWIEWIATHWAELRRPLRDRLAAFQSVIVPAGAAGQVQRVGARFALVGTAGELATEAGLTGWEPSESEEAARTCFEAWLAARGGTGNAEERQILRQVRRFLEANGEGRFAWWHRAADDHASKTLNRAGLRRLLDSDGKPVKSNAQFGTEFGPRMPATLGENTSVEFFILRETFTTEVCAGFEPRAVAAVLLKHGCLLPDKGRTYDCKPRLPGIGLAWCYRIPPAIFELDL